jgi:hypothetical protein
MHCLSGRRSLALVPPTPRNLATFAAWASSARYAGVFLPAHCEGVIRMELGSGTPSICPPACVLPEPISGCHLGCQSLSLLRLLLPLKYMHSFCVFLLQATQ